MAQNGSPRLASQIGFVFVAGGGLPVAALAILHMLLRHALLTVALCTVAESGIVLLLGELYYKTLALAGRWLESHPRRSPRPAPRSVPISSRNRDA